MKELQERTTVNTAIERQVRKTRKLIGSVRLHAGQLLWEYNIDKGTIEPAKVEAMAHIDGGVKLESVLKENCLYVVAINRENAWRKIIKLLKQP